ncbi:MAG TPA: hypothetical protein VFM68_02880 [Candidatus Saccharimonadales bacterium]|nr:hypothetical protein [Candidatus Saccharimonadales bacterium]
MELFVYIPWLAAVGLAVVAAVMQRNFRTPLLVGTIIYTATNFLVFLYVFLQPNRSVDDNRWLEGAKVIKAPKMPEVPAAPDLSGIPLAGDTLSESLNGFSDSMNDIGNTFNQTSASVTANANLFSAYQHTFGLSSEFLLYTMYGVGATLVALMIYIVAQWWQKRAEKKALYDVVAELRNFKAYSVGRDMAGHAAEGWPYSESFDFTVENGYSGYDAVMRQAQQSNNQYQYAE